MGHAVTEAATNLDYHIKHSKDRGPEYKKLIDTFHKAKSDYEKAVKASRAMKKGGPGSGNFAHAGRPGEVGGSAGGDGKASLDKSSHFNRAEWEALPFQDRVSKWNSLSPAERDNYAQAETSIPTAQKERLAFAGKRPKPTGDVSKDIESRMSQFKDFITPDSHKQITNTATELDGLLEGLGVSPELRYKIGMEATDSLVAQENETLRRQLGDHGIAHIRGNIDMTRNILSTVPGADSAEDIAGAYLANIFHDSGYLAPPGQMVAMDQDHPRWSTQHYDENIRPLVEKALGKRSAGTVSNMIRNHAGTDINWSDDPTGSAVRMADNLALFRGEKLPGLFRHVPANIGVLEALQGKKITVEDAHKQMLDNIQKSSLSNQVKEALTHAVPEVGGMTGKFTLGMLGGRIKGFDWVDNKAGGFLRISMTKSPEATRLQKLFDLGQRPFQKFAETFGIDPVKFSQTLSGTFEKNGKTIFQSVIVGEKEFLKRSIIRLYSGRNGQ